jgi:hypothetical protein
MIPEVEPPDGLAGGVLDPKGFGMLDDGPGRREAAAGHYHSPARALRIAGLSGFLTLIQSRDGPDR